MSKTHGEKASVLAANLIAAQVRSLPVTLLAVSRAFDNGDAALQRMTGQLFERKLQVVKTGSGGNIVAEESSDDALPALPYEKAECLRVIVSNALLAVGLFLREHDMASMRTPEIQFLGRAVDAILNANTFRIAPGHMPVAAFDGLVINASLDGKALFADAGREGFMTFGDAIALLEWLARYLHGEKNYVSGGDAG
ncbi:MAG: hypothetical protein K2X64_03750 [Rhodocyclaceae bacterium]|nr:hypothetical protein [Rhodocyclaceae bacterium]